MQNNSYDKEIQNHYKNEVNKFGLMGESTINDINIRDLEIRLLLEYIKDDDKILEVGCGNGFTSQEIIKIRQVDIEAIDFSEDMIRLAKQREIANTNGTATFNVGNALELNFPDDTFDIVFTERCLINLLALEDQNKAIMEIKRVMKTGGIYIMIEAFTDGLLNMDMARKELGLHEIGQPFHNNYFDRERFLEIVSHGFKITKEDNFLSSYYFGSRIIYPAILPKGVDPKFGSIINDFFKNIPSHGNFSPIKSFILEKQ